ncbi:MAG: nucleotide exchange factor GrpE [Verrucomicrobiota bacterium]
MSKEAKTDKTTTDSPAAGVAEPPTSSAPAPEIKPLTAEQIEELKTNAAKATENWDKYVRAVAELDNYKKRAARERSDAVRFANEGLLEKLVPVIDNFEMALAAAKNGDASAAASLQTGITMIQSQLKSVLADAGLEEIDAAGKPFDPNFHEAVSQQESADVPEGHVLQQLRKGYKLKERLIRPATVIVAKKPATG